MPNSTNVTEKRCRQCQFMGKFRKSSFVKLYCLSPSKECLVKIKPAEEIKRHPALVLIPVGG